MYNTKPYTTESAVVSRAPLCSLMLPLCRRWFLFSCAFLVPVLFGATGKAGAKESSALARVAVLAFANSSNLSEYEYLSESISDTIRSRLNQIFEYEKVSQKKVTKRLSSLLKKAKRRWYQMQLLDIKALAKKEKLDIVIYGNYRRIAKTKDGVDQAEIITSIYFAKKDQNVVLDTSLSELSIQILTTAETIAEHSVDEIQIIVGGEEEDDSPAILVNVNVGEDQSNSKEVRKEIKYIRRHLEKEHGQKVIFLSDYLGENKGVPPPESVKEKSSLVRWSKKYDIKKIIRVRVKIAGDLVQIDVIKEGRPQKEVQYELNAPPEVKKENLKQVKKLLKIRKKRGKVSLSVAAVSKYNWKDASYEIGLNPFYQATLGAVGQQGPLSPLGGGAALYFRTPLSSMITPGKQASAKNSQPSANRFADSLFFGVHLSANYFQQTFSSSGSTEDMLFQSYLVSFEIAFLYTFTGELRAGLSLRPGYYIGFSSQSLGTVSTGRSLERLYSGFVLPVFLEMNYLFSDRFALNVGLGNFIYDILGNTVHGLSCFIGVSYVFKR